MNDGRRFRQLAEFRKAVQSREVVFWSSNSTHRVVAKKIRNTRDGYREIAEHSQTDMVISRKGDGMMTAIRCWHVDAFTDKPFGGNPAVVCWMQGQKSTEWMQSVAAEMNLSETAFVRRLGDDFELRWFTPTMEVDLCGHATLATAHALWTEGLCAADQPLRFHTRSGLLPCRMSDGLMELDFPSTPPREIEASANLFAALGVTSGWVGESKFYRLVVLDAAEQVRNMRPDFRRIAAEKTLGIIVTAPSEDSQFDFISRFFAPAMGVDEDPVCGSAHCCLAPYWANRLQKQVLSAYQASARGGVLRLRYEGERVILGGRAVTVSRGELIC
jgi:PhzF family phenazine biosynthesis protein